MATDAPVYEDPQQLDLASGSPITWAGRLGADESVTLPDAPFVHLYVARGTVSGAEIGELAKGDAARLTHAGALCVTAGPEGAEVLAWEMQGAIDFER